MIENTCLHLLTVSAFDDTVDDIHVLVTCNRLCMKQQLVINSRAGDIYYHHPRIYVIYNTFFVTKYRDFKVFQ